MFVGWGSATDPVRGMVDALIDGGLPVKVIPEWKLAEAAPAYPLPVVPGWTDIGESVRNLVAGRVRNGGLAIVAGAANNILFSSVTDLHLSGPAAEKTCYVSGNGVFANVTGLWQPAAEPAGSRSAVLYPTFDSSQPSSAAAVASTVGRGRIVTIPGPVGTLYARSHGAALRKFITSAARKLFTPMVRVAAMPAVELLVRRKDGRPLIFLKNAAGMQVDSDYVAGGFVPHIRPVDLQVTLPKAPARATLEPGGKPSSGRHANGVWPVTIPRLELYDIIAIS